MINLFINCFIVTSIFYVYGTLFTFRIKCKNYLAEVTQSILFGAIFVSFLSLLINFFIPLNEIFGNFFLFFSLAFFFVHQIFIRNKIKILPLIILVSLLGCIFVSYDNINRPDGGLYHLPYIQILNENKIIIGLTNLHFRFGHISSIQYLSAVFKNSYMPLEAINLPTAILISSFLFYLISYFENKYKNKKIKLFIFLLIVYSMYSFNRFSNYGNDASAHIYVFLFFIYFLQIDFAKITKDNISLLSIISVFLFTQKIFMGLFMIIPFFIFIYNSMYKKKIEYKLIFSFLFLLLWLTKNILVSGCAIYPIQMTCFKNLKQTNLENTKKIEIESEAWSKDWSSQKNIGDYSEYVKDFKWVKTWKNNHFNVIKTKITLYIIFLILFLLYSLIFFKNKNKLINFTNFDKKFLFIFAFSFFLTIFWFLKFPLYRYGQSFLIMPLIIIYFYLIYYFVNYKRLVNAMKFIVSILFIIIISKNFIRMYEKNSVRNIWPNIYTLSELAEDNVKPQLETIYRDEKFIYYYNSKGECMYSSAPCSNFKINNLDKIKVNNYDVFFLNNSYNN